jgi:putative chitinase
MLPGMLSAQLIATCTGARMDRVKVFLQPLQNAFGTYAINTPARQAAFLANVGHESGGLRYTTEIWGPTPVQLRYEGRADLGNTQTGDGYRFRGHGLIQTTGRANHAAARDRLRQRLGGTVPDFEADPDALALPVWAALSAGDYWDMCGLNAWADRGDFDGVCDLINRGRKSAKHGDSNGWAERLKLYKAAQAALQGGTP